VGHSLGEIAMSHGCLVFGVEGLAVASGERGPWAPYVGKLWDAAPMGSFESAPAIGHGPRADTGAGPLVWLTVWFPRRMWPDEAIPWVSSL